MVMKASLQLRLGQSLTMTPQLQQAIRLLQLSTLDLQQEIQEALESNPMLEVTESEDNSQDNSSNEDKQAINDNSERTNTEEKGESAEVKSEGTEEVMNSEDWSEAIPTDLPVDTAWDDIYPNNAPSGPAPEEDTDFESRNSVSESLQDHLLWQLNLTPMTDTDKFIAMSIIDSINTNGYLSDTLEEIHGGLLESLSASARNNTDHEDTENTEAFGEIEIELDEVQAVLKRIQHFDPPGVASRDLQECLLTQLNQLPSDTPWLPQAKLVISHYLNLLGNRDYAQLIRRSRIKEDDLKLVIQLIQTLNPRPGEHITDSSPEYVVPDVFVKKVKDRWKVELNPEIAPKIRVNSGYASLVKRADSSPDNTFMKDHLQEAKWFIKSLQSRNETLLKVSSKIVEHQQGFLDHGEEAMKPLVLHDIAEAVEMHESTISRVTTQKYMHTPRGIFELKYFFSSHVSTASGGECSSTAIRAIIKKLVAAEAPKKPLSDSKIATILDDQGIKVARRTIAKYREAMSIPPSNERKRLV